MELKLIVSHLVESGRNSSFSWSKSGSSFTEQLMQ